MLDFQGKLLAQGTIARGADLTPMNISQLPEADYKAFMEGEQLRIKANERFLQLQYSNHDEMPDLSNYAGTKPYATVMLGGQVVATIDTIPFPSRRLEIDDEAMKRDPMYSQLQSASKNYTLIEQQQADSLAMNGLA